MKKIILAVMILLIASSAMAGPTFWGGGGGSSSINPGGTGILNCSTYTGGVCTVFTVNSALTTIGGLTPVLNKVIIGDGGTPSAWSVSSSALDTAAYLSATSPTFLTSLTVSSTSVPEFFLHDASQPANSRDWVSVLANGNLYLEAIDDAHGTPQGWFTCDRSGNCTATGGLTSTAADGSRSLIVGCNTSSYSPGAGESGLYCVGTTTYVTVNGVGKIPMANDFSNSSAGALASGTTATTQSAGDDSTKVATTAYVDGADAVRGVYTGHPLGTCTNAMAITPANGKVQTMTLTNGDTCALTFTQPATLCTAAGTPYPCCTAASTGANCRFKVLLEVTQSSTST
jgi:hypothetical protein